jgi:hypothetical protein
MKHYILLIVTFFAIVLSSCQDQSALSNYPQQDALIRSSANLALQITSSDRNVIEVNVVDFIATYSSGELLTLVINPGTLDEQTYSALAIEVSHEDAGLKLIKDQATQNEIVYKEKSTAVVTTNGQNALSISINPNTIVTSGTSIVGEEMGGL